MISDGRPVSAAGDAFDVTGCQTYVIEFTHCQLRQGFACDPRIVPACKGCYDGERQNLQGLCEMRTLRSCGMCQDMPLGTSFRKMMSGVCVFMLGI